MKTFDIYTWQPPGWPEPHPCVIVSHPDRTTHKPDVEVVICSTQTARRLAAQHEIILDLADGLDWETLCKCDLIYAVPRGELKHRRGNVSLNRRRQLVQTIIAAHGWAQVLAG